MITFDSRLSDLEEYATEIDHIFDNNTDISYANIYFPNKWKNALNIKSQCIIDHHEAIDFLGKIILLDPTMHQYAPNHELMSKLVVRFLLKILITIDLILGWPITLTPLSIKNAQLTIRYS